MTDEKIKSLIPTYPEACSVLLLAINLGLVKKGYSKERTERALRKFEKRLAWLTLRDSSIAEDRAKVQLTTRLKLSKLGFDNPEEIEMSYLSIIPGDTSASKG